MLIIGNLITMFALYRHHINYTHRLFIKAKKAAKPVVYECFYKDLNGQLAYLCRTERKSEANRLKSSVNKNHQGDVVILEV